LKNEEGLKNINASLDKKGGIKRYDNKDKVRGQTSYSGKSQLRLRDRPEFRKFRILLVEGGRVES